MNDTMLLEYLDETDSALWKGEISYARFVHRVDLLVDTMRREGHRSAGGAFKLWGQMEIINAIDLSKEDPLSDKDISDIKSLINELRALLTTGG